MAYFQDYYTILNINQLNKSCFDMYINCPEITSRARAGQFLHITCDGKTLRRPISICEIDKNKGTIRIVFDIRGEGTKWLSQKKAGENLNILGPVGNGFDFGHSNKSALLIGGGMGIPPLLEAAKAFNGNADAILGFRCSENMILFDEFSHYCSNIDLTSDDGSCGAKGFVTNVLINKLSEKKYDVIYSCGPVAMLKAVSNIAFQNNITCYISMEERMGCGVGACLVCACKVKAGKSETYKHVCKDGPVFNAKEVIW